MLCFKVVFVVEAVRDCWRLKLKTVMCCLIV